METSNWKIVILSRYLGDYRPADNEEDATAMKSSEDIKYDLTGMGEFSIEEISVEMVARQYKITVDQDGKPKWLMRKSYKQEKLITMK